MTKNAKLNLQLTAALFLIFIGCGLLVAGFIVSPLGVIHGSVLTAFGESCTFGGALFGIDYTYKFKIRNIARNSDNSENSK